MPNTQIQSSGPAQPGFDEYKFSVRMNIQIYLYPKNDTKEYPNICICIKKIIRMNIRIYPYQENDTNMIQMNICIGQYLNIRIYSSNFC